MKLASNYVKRYNFGDSEYNLPPSQCLFVCTGSTGVIGFGDRVK